MYVCARVCVCVYDLIPFIYNWLRYQTGDLSRYTHTHPHAHTSRRHALLGGTRLLLIHIKNKQPNQLGVIKSRREVSLLFHYKIKRTPKGDDLSNKTWSTCSTYKNANKKEAIWEIIGSSSRPAREREIGNWWKEIRLT